MKYLLTCLFCVSFFTVFSQEFEEVQEPTHTKLKQGVFKAGDRTTRTYNVPVQVADPETSGEVTVEADAPQQVYNEIISKNMIVFKPGFHAQAGSEFHAYLDFKPTFLIDAGNDYMFCDEGLDIYLGSQNLVTNPVEGDTYTYQWVPVTYETKSGQIKNYLDNPLSNNPKLLLDSEMPTTEFTVIVTASDGSKAYDFVSVVNCNDVDPILGFTFSNHGVYVYVDEETELNVDGNILTADVFPPGKSVSVGKWINKSNIHFTKDWINHSISGVFVYEDVDDAGNSIVTDKLSGNVYMTGNRQSLSGIEGTHFNNLFLENTGSKNLLVTSAEEETYIHGRIKMYESDLYCNTNTLVIENTDPSSIDIEDSDPRSIYGFTPGRIFTFQSGIEGAVKWKFPAATENRYRIPLAGLGLVEYADMTKSYTKLYRPAIIETAGLANSKYFSSALILSDPFELNNSVKGPNVINMNVLYYHRLELLNEDGTASADEVDKLKMFITSYYPEEDYFNFGGVHLEPVDLEDEDPVFHWKYTRGIEGFIETGEIFGLSEVMIPDWYDFTSPYFTAGVIGIRISSENAGMDEYTVLYPDGVEPAKRHDAGEDNLVQPTMPPAGPYRIKPVAQENTDELEVILEVSSSLEIEEVKVDLDGEEYPLAEDLYVTSLDPSIELFSTPKKPDGYCKSIIKALKRDGIELLPDPLNSDYSLEFEGIESGQNVKISVFDGSEWIIGTSASSGLEGNFSANSWSWQIPNENVKEGVYTFYIDVNGQSLTGQFTIHF